MDIIPGIRMVDGSVGCNTYLIIDDGITLVDTGLRGNVPRIYSSLIRSGYGPRDIKRIVLTHAHLDHINCLHKLKEDTGALIFASEHDADIIAGKKPLKAMSGLFGIMFGALQTYYKYKPVPVDVRLKDGDAIPGAFDFKAVGLPGHSEGNLGLYSKSKKAFISSDSIRIIDGKLAPPSQQFTPDMRTAIASIRRIGDCDFDVLLPGHGQAVMENASLKVRELCQEISK